MTVAAAAAVAATLLGVGVQAAAVTDRGVAAVTDADVLAAVSASPFGTSALMRIASLAVLALVVRTVWRRWAVALGLGSAVVASGSFLAAGHTVDADPAWLAIASGLAHTLAAAAWFGGLVLLAVTLRARRRDAHAAGSAAIVSRFSALATAAVVLVSVAGAARVTTLMPMDLAALGSAYGFVLAAKVLVVGLVLVIAGYNHRYLVPAVRAAGEGAQRRLRATVRCEGTALLVVIAVSAVLANLSPPAA